MGLVLVVWPITRRQHCTNYSRQGCESVVMGGSRYIEHTLYCGTAGPSPTGDHGSDNVMASQSGIYHRVMLVADA